MKRHDLTLGASGELQIAKLEKTRSELLKDASDSVSKLQRLMKRYEDQIIKPEPSKPFGPYHSAHPMTECIADQKGKKNPPRNPAAVCSYIRSKALGKHGESDFSVDAVVAEWDSMSKAEQEALTAKIEEGLDIEKAFPKEYTKFIGECMKRTDGDMAACVKEYKEKSKSDPDKYPPISGEAKKASDDDPEILEDMSAGGKKPVKDVSIGAGSPAPTTRVPLKPVAVLPGTDKAWTPKAREAAAEARRSKKKPEKEPKVDLREYVAEREKKVDRVGFVTAAPDDVGRPE